MLPKTVTSLAFATACLTAIATMPAYAQKMAPGSAPGTQTYQGSTAPNWSQERGPALTPRKPTSNYGAGSSNYPRRANVTLSVGEAAGPGHHQWPAGLAAVQLVCAAECQTKRTLRRLLETNRGFREARMRKECGPITDQELRQQCLASFGSGRALVGFILVAPAHAERYGPLIGPAENGGRPQRAASI